MPAPTAADYELTDDQRRGLELLNAFAAGKHPHAVLLGYAGVGKTWLVTHWLDTLHARCAQQERDVRVVVLAYTNKAVDVIRSKASPDVQRWATFRTLDSFLGYRVKRNDDGEVERTRGKGSKDPDLIVVDEGSMVPQSYLEELQRRRAPLLFVGDPAQLAPVGEATSRALQAPAEATVLMTQVTRQAQGNPITELATVLRGHVVNNTQFILPDVRAAAGNGQDPRVAFTSITNVHEWCDRAMRKGYDARILAFTNAAVSRHNAAMHAMRYPDAPLFGVGEVALVDEGWEIKGEDEGEDVFLYNGQLLTVTACTYGRTLCDTVEVYDVSVTLEDGRDLVLPVALDPAKAQAVHKTLTDAIWKARREGRHDEAQKLVLERRPLNKLAPLRHSYASTVHKSQGSTYDVAFVNFGDVYRSQEMRARLMYVAVTRPSNFLVVVH